MDDGTKMDKSESFTFVHFGQPSSALLSEHRRLGWPEEQHGQRIIEGPDHRPFHRISPNLYSENLKQ